MLPNQDGVVLQKLRQNLIIAESEVVTNKPLIFENVIGPLTDLNSLSSDLAISINLPNSLNNALEVSRKNNPDLIISKLEYEQSEKDIKIAKSIFLQVHLFLLKNLIPKT